MRISYTHTYDYCALYVSIVLGEYFLHNINNFVEHTKAVFFGNIAQNLYGITFTYCMV